MNFSIKNLLFEEVSAVMYNHKIRVILKLIRVTSPLIIPNITQIVQNKHSTSF